MKRKNLMILAEKELLEASRNRLVLGFGAVFFVLALTLSIIGFISPGAEDVQFSRVGVSLLNLVALLVPLIALLLGSQGFAGEFEDGTMELLLTQPVGLAEICLGRIMGQWAALAAALLAGFGGSGLVLMLLSSDRRVLPFLVNLGTALSLALIFLILGSLVSLQSKNRLSALFTALALWFGMVILYDILVVQVLMISSGSTSMILLYVLMVLNPSDLLRILAIRLTDLKELFGPTTEAMAALPGFQAPAAAVLVWLAWVLGLYWAVVRTLYHRVYKVAHAAKAILAAK
ncbi:ABC transporter permease [Desulfosporosinus sp. PR]|uniref:ABC transporter permease n=1 Tax=Candidatus Desulfosporosinus nitrosoreducens TaxID=3401928 RepID=UPI0027F023C0|nr:ABC transporter permease [Desulfosporosinus sp. PR]MDQ7097057.1 ABC transporter permease [Desulfosporosinus sp. PR]